jgi:hypothetical protein
MNPQEFPWTADQQVTVKNTTEHDHHFMVHGKSYLVRAHKASRFAGYIAWIYVYEMAVKQAQADGKFESWNDEGFREPYYQKFVQKVDALAEEVPIEEDIEADTGDEVDLEDTPEEPPNPPPGQGVAYQPPRNKGGRPPKVHS